MDKKQVVNLIAGEKYYSINDLRYNQKVGIMFSKDRFEQFLETKDQLIAENVKIMKRLPLKTFNSKYCFYVDGYIYYRPKTNTEGSLFLTMN